MSSRLASRLLGLAQHANVPGDPGADATGRPGRQRAPRFRSSATGGAAPVTAGAGSGRWR